MLAETIRRAYCAAFHTRRVEVEGMALVVYCTVCPRRVLRVGRPKKAALDAANKVLGGKP